MAKKLTYTYGQSPIPSTWHDVARVLTHLTPSKKVTPPHGKTPK